MTTENQAPEGAQAAALTALQLDGLRNLATRIDEARGEPICVAWAAGDAIRAALAAPAPQAPVALTPLEIERGREQWGGERFDFTAGVRFAERAHGIPAPQTKEPTNDR